MEEEKQNQKRNEKAEEIVKIFSQIQLYPYGLDLETLEKLEKKLIGIYKKGDDETKGMILFFISDRLADQNPLTKFISSQSNPKVPKNVLLKTALSFYNSLDGHFFLLSLLGKLDDELSLKLITYYLTKYLSQPGRFYYLLAEKCLLILGESKNPYSLNFLLQLYNTQTLEPSLVPQLLKALDRWRDKIGRIRIKQKKKFMEELEKVYKKTGSIGSYYS